MEFGLDWFWFGLVWSGLVWFGVVWSGSGRGLVEFGLVQPCQAKWEKSKKGDAKVAAAQDANIPG